MFTKIFFVIKYDVFADYDMIDMSATHSKLDVLFYYSTTLAEICLDLLKKIIKSYNTNDWWARLLKQLCTNKNLYFDKAQLLFIIESSTLSHADFYVKPRLQKVSPQSTKKKLLYAIVSTQ